MAVSAISDDLKDREAATFAAPEPAIHVSRMRSSRTPPAVEVLGGQARGIDQCRMVGVLLQLLDDEVKCRDVVRHAQRLFP